MHIYWLGESSFKIKTSDTTIAIDPAHKKTGLPQLKIEAEIILISNALPTDIERVNSPKNIEAEPFIVDSPGEYEHRGVFIYGLPTEGGSTLYLIKADDLDIAHLAGLAKPLTDKQLELLEECHIALVPVGDEGVLDAKGAESVVSQLEPRIVIPMNYQIPKLTTLRKPVDVFLREMGAKDIKPQISFSITKNKLPQDEMQVVLLET